jgi:hypothetical protein
MANTTNFNWETPDDTDLVKDGAAAMRTLGNSIDTTTKALNPSTTLGDIEYRSATANTNTRLPIGTTGQVLAVVGGVPAWATTADQTPLTTKGDLFTFDTADARIGVGANGTVLTANSATATGLEWVAPSIATPINKNYLINGGFAISQRGTSFVSGANNDDAYTLDRWYILSDTNDVIDVTQDTTTVPTNGQFAIALDVETANKKFGIATIIENKDVIGLVGNTVTFSFKAKVSSTTKLDNVKAAIVAWSGTADTVTSDIISAWGAEGTNPTLIADATYENSPANLSVTTSYATYSVSAAVDTASTKNLILFVWSDVTDTTAGDFLYIAESKLELGSTATAFVYAGGTIQGELAACQRYYFRTTGGEVFANGIFFSTTKARVSLNCPVTMRTDNGAIDSNNLWLADGSASTYNATAVGYYYFGKQVKLLEVDVASGGTASRPVYLSANAGSSASYIGVTAEL